MLDEEKSNVTHYSISIAGCGAGDVKAVGTISQVLHLPLLHEFETQQLVVALA